ncbi:MAG TPA: BBE domain-containing protein [Streptosporangiaceae bacterium]|nr:BBE domain-containing protein [Streptosporangiaceae bacterium]
MAREEGRSLLWRQAQYGANYTRLAQVKAANDPDGVFTFPQAV